MMNTDKLDKVWIKRVCVDYKFFRFVRSIPRGFAALFARAQIA